jgi:hypothetical protein
LIRGAASRAPAQSVTNVDVAVARTSDDAEESTVGSVNLTSSDLELVDSNGNQTVGLRFASLAIPRGATILDAYVQFEVDKATSTATELFVQGQAAGNAPTFTTATRDVSARSRTNAVVTWRPPAWLTAQVHGVDQRTPDLSSVVAEIVGRADWASGNGLVLIVTGTGKRVAESYNGSAAPVLRIAFATDGSTTTTAASTTTTSTTTSSTSTTSTTTSSTTAPPTTAATTTAPGPTTTTAGPVEQPGSFRAVCKLSHQAQVDPIVAPGMAMSAHQHDFFGNRSTSATSTYATMATATTTCTNVLDLAGYWSPSLVSPTGAVVRPTQAVFYYRNRPTDYGHTVAFPPDFRLVAGGATAFPNTYWTCDGDSDTSFSTRRATIPNCGSTGKVKLHVFFPSCWDGQHLDAPDHRSHMAYGLDDHGNVDGTNPDTCPPGYPVKVPQLDFRVLFPVGDATGYHLSDGEQLAHSDFWNTWVQSELERLVDACLRAGKSCGES